MSHDMDIEMVEAHAVVWHVGIVILQAGYIEKSVCQSFRMTCAD